VQKIECVLLSHFTMVEETNGGKCLWTFFKKAFTLSNTHTINGGYMRNHLSLLGFLFAFSLLTGCAITPDSGPGSLCCETASGCTAGKVDNVDRAAKECLSKDGASYTDPAMSCVNNACGYK